MFLPRKLGNKRSFHGKKKEYLSFYSITMNLVGFENK